MMHDDEKQFYDDISFAIVKKEYVDNFNEFDVKMMEIKSLSDVFQLFGYSKDDFVEQHDQSAIFTTIEMKFTHLLQDVAMKSQDYDQGIILRDRLKQLKKEFHMMQEMYERRRQKDEKQQFQRGVLLLTQRHDALYARRMDRIEDEILKHSIEMEKTHQVQTEQLEMFLQTFQKSHVKDSKELLELKTTEKNLAKFQLFEEARKVSIRVKRMEEEEKEKKKMQIQLLIDTKRMCLRQKQEDEEAEMKGKMIDKRYVVKRRNEKQRQIEKQRVKNLNFDMQQSHTMDLSRKHDVSERKSYRTTSSTYRGQQLLSTVRGKRLQVASLCRLHDSEDGILPSGSVIYTD